MKHVIFGVAMLALLLSLWFYSSLGPDPRFTLDRLRGRSRAEVLQEFGQPIVDEKDTPAPGEETLHYNEPHSYLMDYGHAVVLEEGKVYRVTTGSK
jgi:hypothetical protein